MPPAYWSILYYSATHTEKCSMYYIFCHAYCSIVSIMFNSATHNGAYHNISPPLLKCTVLFHNTYCTEASHTATYTKVYCYAVMHTVFKLNILFCHRCKRIIFLFRHAYWSIMFYSATRSEVYHNIHHRYWSFPNYLPHYILKQPILFCYAYWSILYHSAMYTEGYLLFFSTYWNV